MGSGKQRHALNKYLAGYSEQEISRLEKIHTKYIHTLVIPLYDERFDVVYRLLNTEHSFLSSPGYHDVLFILVVNSPEQGEAEPAARTALLLEHLTAWVQPVFNIENVAYGEVESGHGVIIVDRCSEGRQIPRKQGVGLARKIGADIACYLISNETVKNTWIHSTDADVILPVNYFNCAHTDSAEANLVALIYPFKHVPEKGYEVASELYDWSLRYYVESIEWAGSSYAYHTIGSLIAVDFEAYAKVRGFPKRSGGEDFYLLNKLAKVGEVLSLQSPVINISARPSQRVPFGTGPAICKITENKNAVETHVFYHPAIFLQLNIAYLLIQNSWHIRENKTLNSSVDMMTALELSESKFKTVINTVKQQTLEALDTLGFVGAWRHAVAQSGTEQQFIKQMTVWFDAFKTLKFVHYLRDHEYPSLTLKGVLNEDQGLSDELILRAVKLLSMTAT